MEAAALLVPTLARTLVPALSHLPSLCLPFPALVVYTTVSYRGGGGGDVAAAGGGDGDVAAAAAAAAPTLAPALSCSCSTSFSTTSPPSFRPRSRVRSSSLLDFVPAFVRPRCDPPSNPTHPRPHRSRPRSRVRSTSFPCSSVPRVRPFPAFARPRSTLSTSFPRSFGLVRPRPTLGHRSRAARPAFPPLFGLVLACVSVLFLLSESFFKVCTHLLFVHSHTTSFNKYIYRKYY